MRLGVAHRDRIFYITAFLFTLGVYGPIAAQSITAGLVMAVWFFVSDWSSLKTDSRFFASTALFKPTVFLIIACVFSLLWASLTNLTFFGMQPEINWGKDLKKIWHLLFPFCFAGVLLKLSKDKVRNLIWVWFCAGFLSAVLGIVQHYVPLFKPLPMPDVGLRGLYHATGLTGFHLSFTGIIIFPTAVSMAVLAILARRRNFSDWRIWGAFFSTLCFFAAGIFTYSKIHWAALPLTLIFLSIVGFKGWPRYVLIAAIALFAVVWAFSPEVALRFKGTDSIKERFEVWRANLEMIKQFPLFGVGWHHNSELSYAYYSHVGIKGFASHAHNNFLDQLSTTGFVGLIAFVWWCFEAFRMGFQVYARNHSLILRALGLGFLGGWVGLHINGMTQSNFWDPKILHQIGWVVAVSLVLCRKNKSKI